MSQMAVQAIQHAMLVWGLAGHRTGWPLMVNNDRIPANMATLTLALADELDLPA